MIVPACDRPTVAVPIRAQGRHVMESESAAMHRKMRQQACQLPITGFAHKAANGRRPLAALWANSVMGSRRPCCQPPSQDPQLLLPITDLL